MTKPPPQLPQGNSGILRGIRENFAFHSSPTSFIAQRVSETLEGSVPLTQLRRPIRAKILNRDVAIVLSYSHVQQVLDAAYLDPTDNDGSDKRGEAKQNQSVFIATAPYNAFMKEFFPPPNLLLRDGDEHTKMRAQWQPMADYFVNDTDKIARVVTEWLSEQPRDMSFDIYRAMRDLSWRIILNLILDLQHTNPLFAEIVRLQEILLRGQFSLVPVAFGTGLFQTPHKTGIEARKQLQAVLRDRLDVELPSWLATDMWSDERNQEEVVNHILMSSSSLAVKSLASLLTAFMLNIHLGRVGDRSAREWVSSDAKRRSVAVLTETMRLSPPIIGIMRRASSDTTLKSQSSDPDVLIPQGWDVWPCFQAANRDHDVFGPSADEFDPRRYDGADDKVPSPLVFGAGPKKCLGGNVISSACLVVLSTLEEKSVRLEGQVDAEGVRAWLGWCKASPDQWARDMKQLPTQRPSAPVMVKWMMDKV